MQLLDLPRTPQAGPCVKGPLVVKLQTSAHISPKTSSALCTRYIHTAVLSLTLSPTRFPSATPARHLLTHHEGL